MVKVNPVIGIVIRHQRIYDENVAIQQTKMKHINKLESRHKAEHLSIFTYDLEYWKNSLFRRNEHCKYGMNVIVWKERKNNIEFIICRLPKTDATPSPNICFAFSECRAVSTCFSCSGAISEKASTNESPMQPIQINIPNNIYFERVTLKVEFKNITKLRRNLQTNTKYVNE